MLRGAIFHLQTQIHWADHYNKEEGWSASATAKLQCKRRTNFRESCHSHNTEGTFNEKPHCSGSWEPADMEGLCWWASCRVACRVDWATKIRLKMTCSIPGAPLRPCHKLTDSCVAQPARFLHGNNLTELLCHFWSHCALSQLPTWAAQKGNRN